MTINGWIFLVISWGTTSALVTFCFYHIFFKDRKTDAGEC